MFIGWCGHVTRYRYHLLEWVCTRQPFGNTAYHGWTEIQIQYLYYYTKFFFHISLASQSRFYLQLILLYSTFAKLGKDLAAVLSGSVVGDVTAQFVWPHGLYITTGKRKLIKTPDINYDATSHAHQQITEWSLQQQRALASYLAAKWDQLYSTTMSWLRCWKSNASGGLVPVSVTQPSPWLHLWTWLPQRQTLFIKHNYYKITCLALLLFLYSPHCCNSCCCSIVLPPPKKKTWTTANISGSYLNKPEINYARTSHAHQNTVQQY